MKFSPDKHWPSCLLLAWSSIAGRAVLTLTATTTRRRSSVLSPIHACGLCLPTTRHCEALSRQQQGECCSVFISRPAQGVAECLRWQPGDRDGCELFRFNRSLCMVVSDPCPPRVVHRIPSLGNPSIHNTAIGSFQSVSTTLAIAWSGLQPCRARNSKQWRLSVTICPATLTTA